jgi:hypothetical protein
MEPRNRFQGMNSASLCSLAGQYDNPIPTRFQAPVDCLKIPVQTLRFDENCLAAQKSLPTYEWINYLCIYDLYNPVHNVLDACISITRASGRGWALESFLGPVKWHPTDRRVPFGAQKTRLYMPRWPIAEDLLPNPSCVIIPMEFPLLSQSLGGGGGLQTPDRIEVLVSSNHYSLT